MNEQAALDQARRYYRIDFPSSIDARTVLSWFRQVGAGLYTAPSRTARPSIAFEVVGTAYETTHYTLMPWQDSEHLVQQLHGLIPGASANHQELGREPLEWTYAAEYDLVYPDEPLPLDDQDVKTRWLSILNSMSSLAGDERVILQWVVRPLAIHELPPVRPPTFRPRRFRYEVEEDKKIIAARESKHAEPNFAVSLRIAAYANTESRAHYLVHNLYGRLAGDRGFTQAKVRQDELLSAVTHAKTPLRYGNRLTASELTALVGWPLGSESVVGLSRDAVRHRAPNASVLTARHELIKDGGGIAIGTTTLAGREQTVAIDYESLTTHMFVGGVTQTGKTSVMEVMSRQIMEDDHGLIVLDPKGEMHERILDQIPPHRHQDVINIDFTNGLKPVAFNLLQQGDPRTVVDDILELFQHIYKDNGPLFKKIAFHGLHTLAELEMPINDLEALLAPDGSQEEAWAKRTTAKVKDKALKKFWDEWWVDPKRQIKLESTFNRVWQLTSRKELRYMLGQANSTFYMDDVIRDNKILVINMSRLPKETASIVGRFFFSTAWSSAQRVQRPARSNFLMMDEFHMFSDIPAGFEEVLAMARSYNLCLVTATQYPDQLNPSLQQAILNNARNKIILTSEGKTARFWSSFFSNGILDTDISNLQKYVSITRILTPDGMSIPFTMKTLKPPTPYGSKQTVARLSMDKHGRSIADIEAEEEARRAPLRRKLDDDEALRIALEEDNDE